MSSEKLVRTRQREEICGALRGSSLFHRLYIIKNAAKMVMAIAFIAFNSVWGLQTSDEDGFCKVKLGDKGSRMFGFQLKI